MSMFALMLFATTTAGNFGWNWNAELASGSAIEIHSVAGDIRALPSESGRVEISARFEGGAAVEMRVSPIDGGVAVCAAKSEAGDCANAPGARVDYEVRLPAGVRLVARTVNGQIEAQALNSDVDATTVNGRVDISTSGSARAKTVNGSIRARLLAPFWKQTPQFSAVNGAISVTLPQGADTFIHAETRNGRIVRNLLRFHGSAGERKLKGLLGRRNKAQCAAVEIHTVNGSIDLSQRS